MQYKISRMTRIFTHLVMGAVVWISPSKAGFDVCGSDTCQMTAQMMLDNMDRRVKPCDDFYLFACGNYTKSPIPSEHQYRGTLMDHVNGKILERLRSSFEKNITEDGPEHYKKLLSYYKTCIDSDPINKNSKQEVLELMKSLGGWPVLEPSWNESYFDWKETMYKFRAVGLQTCFISAEFSSHVINHKVKSIVLYQTRLRLSLENLLNGLSDGIVRRYLNLMVDLAVLLGADRAKAQRELSRSLNFEINIAKYRTWSALRQEATTEGSPLTIRQLDDLCPNIPWLEYLTKTLKPSIPLTNSTIIIVNQPEFFRVYCELLARTPKKILANYAFWNIVAEFADLLGPEARHARNKFISKLNEDDRAFAEIPRWIECTRLAKKNMHLATGSLYVREYFNEDAKHRAVNIVQHILRSFHKTFENVRWMGKKSRQAAVEKIKAIKALVAYPDELIDDRKLDSYYENFTVNRTSFFISQLNLNLFKADLASQSYNEPIDMFDWTGLFGDASTANAFYYHLDNAFVLLAGILGEGFFNSDNPNYVNFGGIGSIIGHEISHGFDMVGRLFDKRGNLRNWWDNETEREYNLISHCFSNKYSLYGYFKNYRVDGDRTLSENVADTAGVREAYRAYEIWRSENFEEPRLPGLTEFTPRQIFWLAYANTLCAKPLTTLQRQATSLDSHAPNHIRVILPLMNNAEFFRDFHCPFISFMNQFHRCELW